MQYFVLTTDWQWMNLARSFIVAPSQVAPTDLLRLEKAFFTVVLCYVFFKVWIPAILQENQRDVSIVTKLLRI